MPLAIKTVISINSSYVTCKVSSSQLPKLRDLVLDTVGPKLVWTWAQSWQRNIPFFRQAYLGSARETINVCLYINSIQ